MSYSWIVPIALFGFVPFSLFLFAWLRPLRGLLATFTLGFLLLPIAQYKVEGIPGYDKTTAIALSALLGTMLFDSARIVRFRPRWIDVPMLFWCLAPIASSLSNDLGFYDGCSGAFSQIILCGIPFFLGRLYLDTERSLREFAIAFVLGGLLYVPLCLYEIKMSPQLHAMVYGFQQHSFIQSFRLGGWRPTVFLDHGISVGLFMCSTALTAIWLWRRKVVTSLLGMRIEWVAITLLVVAVICKSTGAIALLVIAFIVLWSSITLRAKAPLTALLLIAPFYILARCSSMGLGPWLVDTARTLTGDRADSLAWRMESEEVLTNHAFRQPIFGWGTWGRNLVNEYGGAAATPDARWVIYLGVNGFFGLISWTAAMLLPVHLALRRVSRSALFSVAYSPVVISCVLLVLFVIDSLLNADHNPAYPLLAGGLGGLGVTSVRARAAASVPRRAGAPRPPNAVRAAVPPAARTN